VAVGVVVPGRRTEAATALLLNNTKVGDDVEEPQGGARPLGLVLFFIFAGLTVALLAVSVLAVVLVARWRRSSWERKRQQDVRCAELRCTAKDGRQLRFSDAVPSRADDDLASSGGGSTTASSTDIAPAKVLLNAFHQPPLSRGVGLLLELRDVAQPHATPATSTPTVFGAEDLFDPPAVGFEDSGKDDLPKPCEEGTPTVPRSLQPIRIGRPWHDDWKGAEDVISICSSMQGSLGGDAASAPAPCWPLRRHLGSLFQGVGGHPSSAPFDVGRHWSHPPPPKASISVASTSETSDSPGSSPRDDASIHEI